MAKAKKIAKKDVVESQEKKCCFCSSNTFKRVLTSLILIPIVFGVLLLGFPVVNVFILAIGAMFAYEWANMVKNSNPVFYALVYLSVLAVGVLLPIPVLFFAIFLLALVLTFIKAKGEKYRKYLMLGVVYVGFALSSFLWFIQEVGFFSTVWLLMIVWSTDIGAYMVGCRLRGPKLAPKISPNKTWSGFFGGILFAVCVSVSFVWGAGLFDFYGLYAVLALVVSVLGQIGDLCESLIKRKLEIKDSSNLIPGHGGIFDRLDSLLFVTPIIIVVIAIVGVLVV